MITISPQICGSVSHEQGTSRGVCGAPMPRKWLKTSWLKERACCIIITPSRACSYLSSRRPGHDGRVICRQLPSVPLKYLNSTQAFYDIWSPYDKYSPTVWCIPAFPLVSGASLCRVGFDPVRVGPSPSRLLRPWIWNDTRPVVLVTKSDFKITVFTYIYLPVNITECHTGTWQRFTIWNKIRTRTA